tara:strand:- start:882 stop:2147 length:1266 start_codon:yes stop_codon:yes gene_type:complete
VLTKGLLCFRTKRGKIHPKFIDPTAPKFLKIAFELTDLFSGSVGENRENLENRSKQVLEGFPVGVAVGRGLEKLLIDRTEFDTESKTEVLELREKVFRNSSALMQHHEQSGAYDSDSSEKDSLESYRKALAGSIGIKAEILSHQLYADLPPFQQVLKFRKITGEGLLHRYNCAQVQGLLLRSEKITVKLPESSAASMRQLLKYLRFNKLLAKISFDHKKRKSLFMQIDGPLSMFLQTQKYGLNLANFFPAVLHQPEWELDATVRIHKNRTYILQLDQSCGIRSHLRQFLAYVPEEIKKLSQQLAKKLPDWTLSSSNDFVHLSGENLCFPDYLLKHISGKKVPLELFHNWHSAPLLNRLSQLDAQKEAPLLIGINRSLLKNKDVANKLESSSYFFRFGFLFRDFPTTAMLLPRLETWLRSRL